MAELAQELDLLQARAGCPVTARRLWQQAWLDTHPWDRLLLVTVERTGVLVGAALLAARRAGRGWFVVPVGDGPSDRVRLPATDQAAAAQLGEGVAQALAGLGGTWSLRARHLDPQEPVLSHLLTALPFAETTPGDWSPRLSLGEDRNVRGYISRNAHQQIRRMRNRAAREALDPRIAVLRTRASVEAVLPELLRVHRARDQQLGRSSQVDDPSAGPFLRRVLLDLAGAGEVELVTLHLDERLAAYVLSFVDGSARRMWNCRFDPEWSHLAPGRIALHAALETALADPSCEEFDWMRGTEDYKSQMSDGAWRAVNLHACSSRSRWAVQEPVRRAATALRSQRDQHEVLAQWWKRISPRLEWLRGDD